MLASTSPPVEGGVSLIQILAIFAAAAFAMAFGALVLGWLLRPSRSNPIKASAYECGELPVGAGWVQFDLRFYVVALVFLIFDVEIALFWPWAVVYGAAAAEAAGDWAAIRAVRWAALWDMLFFFAVIVVGFVYLWRFGYLDWVRIVNPRHAEHRLRELVPTPSQTVAPPPEFAGPLPAASAKA
ncbi:MAG: NADH-quinone oxidoreductase subunit A [Planctomycetota bacterium]